MANSAKTRAIEEKKTAAGIRRPYTGKINTYNDASGVSKEAKRESPKKYGMAWLKK